LKPPSGVHSYEPALQEPLEEPFEEPFEEPSEVYGAGSPLLEKETALPAVLDDGDAPVTDDCEKVGGGGEDEDEEYDGDGLEPLELGVAS